MHCIPHLCCGDVWGVSLGHCDEGIFQPARCDVQRESWNSNGSLRRPPLAVNQQSWRRQDCHVFICFRHIRMSPLVPGQVSDFPCFAQASHGATIEVSYDDGTSIAGKKKKRPHTCLSLHFSPHFCPRESQLLEERRHLLFKHLYSGAPINKWCSGMLAFCLVYISGMNSNNHQQQQAVHALRQLQGSIVQWPMTFPVTQRKNFGQLRGWEPKLFATSSQTLSNSNAIVFPGKLHEGWVFLLIDKPTSSSSWFHDGEASCGI